ncbi:hypothetical protein Taro_033502 [Colocasia esculenta]|uniref:Uncharacterized protein n=1 Tax=Colocasia esculenta TaxID=4460 RepID=A0A843W758_COLES|nr:hypothetical protein [Colocasia esculenta]
MASAATRAPEGTPSPVIGKAGRYTVFITPSATTKTPSGGLPPQGPGFEHLPGVSPSPKAAGLPPPPAAAKEPTSPPPLRPVQVPPQQFCKSTPRPPNSVLGFFWGAVARVQDVHSSLDEYLADWLGLNQSRYQWALDDYYEKKEMVSLKGRVSYLS